MLSTTPSDIVLVPFPFADLSSTKKRPCLVLGEVSARGFGTLVIVAMMTSHQSRVRLTHDVPVLDWQNAGLPKATTVRLSKIVTLDQAMVTKKFGTLSERDQRHIRSELKSMFSFWLSTKKSSRT